MIRWNPKWLSDTMNSIYMQQHVVVQLLSRVRLFTIPACSNSGPSTVYSNNMNGPQNKISVKKKRVKKKEIQSLIAFM